MVHICPPICGCQDFSYCDHDTPSVIFQRHVFPRTRRQILDPARTRSKRVFAGDQRDVKTTTRRIFQLLTQPFGIRVDLGADAAPRRCDAMRRESCSRVSSK